jgi:hypothetical protein
MRIARFVVGVVLLTLSCVGVGRGDEAKFPSDNEIQLVLTQADRAMVQDKLAVADEERQMGKAATEAVAKDRQVIQAVELAVQTFKKQPQGFNSAAGFAFFEWRDDADRNALLCAQAASSQSAAQMLSGSTERANDLLRLSQSCMDVSALIYTVSENAGALYEKYAKGEQELAEEGFNVSKSCTEALKKMANDKKH